MCYWLLPASGVPIARTTVEKIQADDLMTDKIKDEIKTLDQALSVNLKSENQEAFHLYRANFYEEDIADDAPIEP
jgi:hypothetical protein